MTEGHGNTGRPTEVISTGRHVFPPTRIQRLRALRAAATGGRWVRTDSIHAESAIAVAGLERTRRIADVATGSPDYGRGNADCIVEAVNALPELLDALESVEAERDHWRQRALAAEDALPATERSR